MRIFLIGYMGSGKSTVGKELASILHFPFFDLDRCIEEKQGASIEEIFNHKGEPTFRKWERQALEDIITKDNVVIATGGGTPCFYNNIDLMNEQGITFYLNVCPERLTQRLSQAKTIRPLIKAGAEDALSLFVEEELKRRECFYKQATFVIDTKDLDIMEVAKEIEQHLSH